MPYTPEQVEEYLDFVNKNAGDKYTPDQIQEYSNHIRENYGKPDIMDTLSQIDPTNPDTSFATPGQRKAGAMALGAMGAAALAGPSILAGAVSASPLAKYIGVGGGFELGHEAVKKAKDFVFGK